VAGASSGGGQVVGGGGEHVGAGSFNAIQVGNGSYGAAGIAAPAITGSTEHRASGNSTGGNSGGGNATLGTSGTQGT